MAQSAPSAVDLEGAAINMTAIRCVSRPRSTRSALTAARSDLARRELLDALEQSPGKKALVIDASLAGSITLLVQPSVLKARRGRCLLQLCAQPRRPQERRVDELFYLDENTDVSETEAAAVLFLVRPRVELMGLLAKLAKSLSRRAEPSPPQLRVLFVPRRTLTCERALEEAGVLGDLQLCELPLHWLPHERDLLLLAADGASSLRDAVVFGDAASGCHALARALHALQKGFTGTVPLLRGKGAAAKALADQLLRLRREEAASGGAASFPCPAAAAAAGCVPPPVALLLLDRAADWVTPLVTPLTYEGLIDEVLGIANGAVTVPGDGGGRKARLDSRDPLFAELRDLNFGAACDALRAKSNALAEDYRAIKGDERDSAKAERAAKERDVREIGGFVRKIRDNMGGAGVDLHATIARALLDRSRERAFSQRLAVERGLAEGGREAEAAALDAAETLCFRRAPVCEALRMMCLAALQSGPLPPKRLEGLRKEFLAAYGARHAATLAQAAAAGLFPPAAPGAPGAAGWASGFAAARAPLHLLVEPPAEGGGGAGELGIAFTHSHSGYAPLSVRLAQLASRPAGFRPLPGPAERGLEEALRALPGPAFELAQGLDEHGAPAELGVEPASVEAALAAAHAAAAQRGRLPAVLVCFLGGVTRTELAALRHLSRAEAAGGCGRQFVLLAPAWTGAREVLASVLCEGGEVDEASLVPPPLPKAAETGGAEKEKGKK